MKLNCFVDDIFQMDDGIFAILDNYTKKILLIDLRDKDFEIIQTNPQYIKIENLL